MIITLTTDFGLRDAFAGTMKGVILSLAPETRIVDITHEIPSFDVVEAALAIQGCCRFFPPGTIHIVVVDPGVGSARRPIAVQAKIGDTHQFFIAPDNGVLSLVPGITSVRQITNSGWYLQPLSTTFHGRDIFSPVAAHLALGRSFETVGPVISGLVQLSLFEKPAVLRVDKFGNILTNLRREQLGDSFVIRANGMEVRSLHSHYAEAAPGEIFAIEGSSGWIELSINQESAAERLNLRRGAEFEVETESLNH